MQSAKVRITVKRDKERGRIRGWTSARGADVLADGVRVGRISLSDGILGEGLWRWDLRHEAYGLRASGNAASYEQAKEAAVAAARANARRVPLYTYEARVICVLRGELYAASEDAARAEVLRIAGTTPDRDLAHGIRVHVEVKRPEGWT